MLAAGLLSRAVRTYRRRPGRPRKRKAYGTNERLYRKLHHALAGARDAAGDILRLKPDFSVAAYPRTQPYKDPNSLAPVLGALHTAGLPD